MHYSIVHSSHSSSFQKSHILPVLCSNCTRYLAYFPSMWKLGSWDHFWTFEPADFHKTWYEHYVPVFLFRLFKALNAHNSKTCSNIPANTCGSELYKAKNISNMGSRPYWIKSSNLLNIKICLKLFTYSTQHN